MRLHKPSFCLLFFGGVFIGRFRRSTALLRSSRALRARRVLGKKDRFHSGCRRFGGLGRPRGPGCLFELVIFSLILTNTISIRFSIELSKFQAAFPVSLVPRFHLRIKGKEEKSFFRGPDMLSSQARNCMVWFTGAHKICYVIPLYSGLESALGANLEIEVDLRKSYHYQQQYKRLTHKNPNSPLLNVPTHQTPLNLAVSSQKLDYKTILRALEVSPEHTPILTQQPSISTLS